MKLKPFKACLIFILFIILALLLLHSPFLRVNKAAGINSETQEKGGVVKPTPTSKPRSTPRPSPRTSTSSGTPRKTTAPAKSRQTAPQIDMVLIPAGTFLMGSPELEAERSSHEGPQHRVSVQSFYMGKYEVTQAQYQAVMGTNPSKFKGKNRPVENVSWKNAVEFCRRLSQMTGREYRLPTEAEWEFACRAGVQTPFAFGSSLSSEQANFDGTRPYGEAAKGIERKQTTPVGSFSPNAFGLYDMHGNVWEWCEDYYHDNYDRAPTDGSAWLKGGNSRAYVSRGGGWDGPGSYMRSAMRSYPGWDSHTVGFRVASSSRM